MQFEEIRIEAKGVKSLCWLGDSLVDWVAGIAIYELTGKAHRPRINYAYRFDAAVTSPSGRFAVIYEKLGTKALVLDNGKVVRELNRSFYYAHAYEYPVALFRLPDGREVIAHCLESYCRIEIDDLITGERLTKSLDRKPRDTFFSRLAANANGKKLLMAGWVWHPMDVVAVYDIEAALKDPQILDCRGDGIWVLSEYNSASFIDNDTIAVADFLEKEEYENEEDETPARVNVSGTLDFYDLASCERTFSKVLETNIGTFMPLGLDHLVSFLSTQK